MGRLTRDKPDAPETEWGGDGDPVLEETSLAHVGDAHQSVEVGAAAAVAVVVVVVAAGVVAEMVVVAGVVVAVCVTEQTPVGEEGRSVEEGGRGAVRESIEKN